MSADAILLCFLAIFDLTFLVYVRRRRKEALKKQRVMQSLTMAVHREIGAVDSARTDKLLKDLVREQHPAIGQA
jgi:hypothetical protein